MEVRFSVGDRVRCVDDGGFFEITEGCEYTVNRVEVHYNAVWVNGYAQHRFVLAEPPAPTKPKVPDEIVAFVEDYHKQYGGIPSAINEMLQTAYGMVVTFETSVVLKPIAP